MTFRKGVKIPGQGKHGPPKATLAAREAIGRFVDDNSHRFQEWLDAIANGIPDLDKDGVQRLSQSGAPMWIRAPDPEKAFDMVQKVIEYHVPKLNRSEQHVSGQVSVKQAIEELDRSV